MTDKKYDPPEDEIKRFMEACKHNPRTMAIAYLRARRRATQYKQAIQTMNALDDMLIKGTTGDLDGAKKELEKFKRRLKGLSDAHK